MELSNDTREQLRRFFAAYRSIGRTCSVRSRRRSTGQRPRHSRGPRSLEAFRAGFRGHAAEAGGVARSEGGHGHAARPVQVHRTLRHQGPPADTISTFKAGQETCRPAGGCAAIFSEDDTRNRLRSGAYGTCSAEKSAGKRASRSAGIECRIGIIYARAQA
jgi:hypothetical protein